MNSEIDAQITPEKYNWPEFAQQRRIGFWGGNLRFLAISFLSFLLIALMFVAAIEVLLGMPVNGRVYLALAAMFALSLLRFCPLRKQKKRLLILSAICCVMSTLHFVHWPGRNAFVKRLYSIRPGMSMNEARAIMDGDMGGFIEPKEESPDQKTVGFFRHSNDSADNADVGAVHVEYGRVIGVEFSPD